MGLFIGLFKKHDIYKRNILELAREISFGDKLVMSEMRMCVLDPHRYAKHHEKQFAERSEFAQNADEHTVMWLAMADCLIKNGYAAELDWKCEKDDFVCAVQKLRGVEILGCEINPVHLYDDDDVSSWCAVQDKVWFTKNACIGGIDIDSDSYVLFVCSSEVLGRAGAAAEKIHRRIVHGCDL